MDDRKKKVLQLEAYKLFGLLDLEPELRGCLFSRGLISDHQYQKLQALYDDGEKIQAAEMCLIRYIPHARRVDDECPFESFVSALEEIAERGSSSNGYVANHLRKAASAVVFESRPSSRFGHARSQSLELNRHGWPSTAARTPRKSSLESDIPNYRAVCTILVIGDKFCSTPYLLDPYSAELGCEDQQFTHRHTHLKTPYSYVTLVKDIVLYGRVEVCLIGCRASDDASTGQLLEEVLQNVTKPLCGVILLLEICQSIETVISEMTRLQDTLFCVNLLQLRSVLVPASNAMGDGYLGPPEPQEHVQIRHHAIRLGIHDFHSNLSDAITDIVSHHINDSIAPDGKESDNTAFASKKAALRSKHQKRHSARSCSVSDTESKSSDGGECFHRYIPNYQHGTSSYSMGMRTLRSVSSGHSSLPTIAQSPPQHHTCSSEDDSESLPFGSQPSDCLENIASIPPMPPAEPVGPSAYLCPSTTPDRGRGEGNRGQELYYTVRPAADVESALVISLRETNERRMNESTPTLMCTSSSVATSGGHGRHRRRRRRCTIL